MIQSRIQFRQLCAIAYLPIVESPLPGDIESMRVIRKVIFSYDEEGEKSIDLLFTRVFFSTERVILSGVNASPTKTRSLVLINTAIGVIARLDRFNVYTNKLRLFYERTELRRLGRINKFLD